MLLSAYVASGVYFVQPRERAVVRYFGRTTQFSTKVPPGLHYAPPWPFARVNKVRTTEVRRMYVGLTPQQREAMAAGDMREVLASPASDVLTGDVNILKATMVVQYQVVEPARFLLATRKPERLVHSAVQGALIDALAGMPVDQALTVAKTALQSQVLAQAQKLLDRYECGVLLVATHLESIDPPVAILAAFQDVVNAKKDGEKAVDRAVAESDRTLSSARGSAAAMGESAEGYRQTRLSRARGEAARFNDLLAEYRKNPELFRKRLVLETYERVLPRLRTYIVDDQLGETPTHVRIIDTAPSQPPSSP